MPSLAGVHVRGVLTWVLLVQAFVVVGDSNGHVGLGVKCAKEVRLNPPFECPKRSLVRHIQAAVAVACRFPRSSFSVLLTWTTAVPLQCLLTSRVIEMHANL